MAAAFVAATMAGDGQTAAVISLSVSFPTSGAGAAAGQVAILVVDWETTTATLTDPAGWNKQTPAGANGDSTGNSQSAIYTRTLAGGDPGTSFNLAFSSTRAVATMLVFSGVTESGIALALNSQTTATSTLTLPTLSTVAGALQLAVFARRRSGPAGTITVPAPYTSPASNDDPASAYAAGANVYVNTGYVLSSAGGTVGGEAGSSGTTGIGNNYVVALLLAAAAATATGSITLSGAGPTAQAPTSAGGSISLGGSGATARAAATAAGSISLGGAGTAKAAGTSVGSISLGGSGIPTLPPAATGSITLAGAGTAQARGTGITGVITLAGSAAAAARASVTTGVITLAGLLAQASFRFQVWTGIAWKPITPLVWDGTSWSAIPVTIVPSS